MAYTLFAKDKPVIADTGAQVVDATRNNLMALRDAIVSGTLQGWTIAVTAGTGTAEQPQTIVYSNGVERVRLTTTWGSSGGALGNPQVVVFAYSGNSGGAYDTIGTATYSYDASGNMTGIAWS